MCAMFLISFRSIILYLACILSFVWRAGTTNHEQTYVLSSRAELGIRIAFSGVFALGVVYFALVTRTFWQYGDHLDRSFKAKVASWARERMSDRASHRSSCTVPQMVPPSSPPPPRPYSPSTGEETLFPSYTPYRATTPASSTYHNRPATPPRVRPDLEPFSPQKIMDLRFQSQDGNMMPESLQSRFDHNSWWKFIEVPHYTCAYPRC